MIIVVVIEIVDDNGLMSDETTERVYVVLDEVNTSSVVTVNVKLVLDVDTLTEVDPVVEKMEVDVVPTVILVDTCGHTVKKTVVSLCPKQLNSC